MFRKIVTYLVAFAIAFQPVSLYATDQDVTVLRARSAYRLESDQGPVDCIDVKRGRTGEIQLAFDPSLHQENTSIYLVLNQKSVGLITYLKNKLNFIGWGDNTFKLESPATYAHPLLSAQVEKRLIINGGQFTKDSIFIADDITTQGKFNGAAQLAFLSKGNMDLLGHFHLTQLNVLAAALKLNAIVEAADINVESNKIDETCTNKFYASNRLSVRGYDEGFQHRGVMKAKKDIQFQGGDYTSEKGAQTIGGCIFQNDSQKTTEAGRVVAGIYASQGGDVSFMPSADFLGHYFIPQIKGKLTLHPGSVVTVQKAAPVWAQGNIALKGSLSKLGVAKINFPYVDLFGLESLKLTNILEGRNKAAEIKKIQDPIFSQINSSGIVLQSAKNVLIGKDGSLKSPDANIVLEGIDVRSRGVIEGGYFEELSTAIKAHSARLSGFIKFHNVSALIDDVLKLNGQIQGKLTVVFTEADRKKKAAEALESQRKAVEEAARKAVEAERVRLQKEAEAKAAVQADALRKQQEAEAARKAVEAAEKAKREEQERLARAQAEFNAAEEAKYRKAFEVTAGANLTGGVSVANADIALLKDGIIRKGNVSIDAKTLIQSEKNQIADVERVQFTGDKHVMGGKVNVEEYIQQTTQSIDIQESAKIESTQRSQYATRDLTVAGQAISQGQSTTVVEKLVITETGQQYGQNNFNDAKQAELAGVMSGERLHVKVEHLNETPTGKMKATDEALIDAKESSLAGENHAPNMHVQGEKGIVSGTITGEIVSTNIKNLDQKENAVIAGTKLTTMTGDTAALAGKSGDTITEIIMEKKLTTGEHSSQKGSETLVMKAPEVILGGKAEGEKVAVGGKRVKITKTGTVHSTVATDMVAEKEYENNGSATSQGKIYMEIPDAHKLGDVKAERGLTIKPQVQPDVNGIWAGNYPELMKSSGLHLIVPKPVQISDSPQVDKDLGLTAPSINSNINLTFKKDGALIANEGDLTLQDVAGRHLQMEAKGRVAFSQVTYTDGVEVKSGAPLAFRNHFTGNGTAQIEATSIYNPLNNLIMSDILSMEATESDINNRGIMQGRRLLNRVAGGAITDEVTWWHAGNTPCFAPAQAIGGSGIEMMIGDEKRRVGLISVAGYKVRNIGSHVSTGDGADAIIDGRYGIENISQAEMYLVASWTKRHGFLRHKKTHFEHYSNVLAEAKEFIGGRVFRFSEHGGFFNSGSLMAAYGQDLTNVHGPIVNAASVLTDVLKVSKKRVWGLSCSKMTQQNQQAQITRFLNNEGITHISRTGGISGQGTLYITPDLILKAAKPIRFDEVLLNHSIRTKSSCFSPTISGIPLFGGNASHAMPGVSLYNDLRGMGQSDADVGRMVTGVQQTWSQINGLSSSYNTGNLGAQVIAQFGELGFSFTSTKSMHKWQTSAPTMMHVKKVGFITPEGVILAGGTQVNASQLFKVDAPRLILAASRLESSSKQESFSIGGGFNPWTYSASMNFGMNKANSHGVNYKNAQVNAPVVDLGVMMDLLGLYGGNINCRKIHGKVRLVDVVTLQDEFHSKHSGFNLNLSTNFANGITNPTGGFSFNMGSSHLKQVTQHSGITATEGFDDSFTIGQLNVTDTHLDPLLVAQAKQVNFTRIYDVNKTHSFGIGMQGLDLSNAEAFANGIAKNATALVGGAAAAEVTKAWGLNDQVASAIAMVASAATSQEINDRFGEGARLPASGIGILGQLNYGHNDHQVNVTGIDFSVTHFKQAAQNLGLMAQDLLVAETPIVVPPRVPVRAEVPIEEEDRPALGLKTAEDEPKKKPAKKTVSDNGKEKADVADESSKFEQLRLPKVARDLIENAPLVLEEYNEPLTVEEKVEARAKKNSPLLYAQKEKMDRHSNLHQGGIDQANDILMDPNATWEDWIWAKMAKMGCQENLNVSAGTSAQNALIMYGSETIDNGFELINTYIATGVLDDQAFDDFLYAGQNLALAGFQLGGVKILGKMGKIKSKASNLDLAQPTLEVTIKFKEGMNVKEFNRKMKRLELASDEGRLFSNKQHGVSKAERVALQLEYRNYAVKRIHGIHKNNPQAIENALERLKNSDIDHMIDMQFGGQNTRRNLKALDKIVNRSIGAQGGNQLPKNEKLSVTIKKSS